MRAKGGRMATAIAGLALLLGAGPARADVFDDNPAAASRAPGDVSVYARGADGSTLERHWLGGGWSDWASLGGIAKSGPAAAPYGGAINLFVVGTDDAVYQNAQVAAGQPWVGWHSLGGAGTSAPAGVARRGTDVFDMAVRGTDNQIHRRYFTPANGWSPWVSLGGLQATSAPALNSQADGVLNVFVRGTDGAIWQRAWNGGAWSDWMSLGGVATSAPVAVTDTPGTVDLFIRGADRALHQRHWNGGAWSDWTRVDPAPVDSGPGAVVQGPGAINLYARAGGGLSYKYWRDNWGPWTPWGAVAPPAPPAPPPTPAPAPNGRLRLNAGIRCTPPGGLLAVDLKVHRRNGRAGPRVRKVRFYVRKGPSRTDHHRPFRVRLRMHRPAGSTGRVYARVSFRRTGTRKLRHKTVSRRFVMCG